jgi:ClpX C4-type zinc finger
MRRNAVDDSLRCSFCHKAQGAVGKLISSPSDLPQAYICDECIAVCNHIIEDDRAEAQPDAAASVSGSDHHPLLTHPLATDFLASAEKWIREESLGGDAAADLAEMRSIAGRMLRSSTK